MLKYDTNPTYWESVMSNLDKPSYIIWVLCITLGFWGVVAILKFNSKLFDGLWAYVVSLLTFFVIIFGVSMIGGGIYYNNINNQNIENNRASIQEAILDKYDLDAIETKYWRPYGQDKISALISVMDGEHGIVKGYNGGSKDSYVPIEELVHVIIDLNTSEAQIIPWEGVDKAFVNSLLRSE